MTELATPASNFAVLQVETFVRLIAIVSAATSETSTSVSAENIHTIAYFADVLAPVYDLPVLYPQILKSRRVSAVPVVQHHLDRLVGMGVLAISDVAYQLLEQTVALKANYSINSRLATPIIDAMNRRERTRVEIAYIHELTLALLGLGTDALWRAAEADATYGDPNVDRGTIVDLLPLDATSPSRAVHFAKAFGSLAGGATLSPSEMINLYVRHLYSILVESAQ